MALCRRRGGADRGDLAWGLASPSPASTTGTAPPRLYDLAMLEVDDEGNSAT
jgi:hypothetical protein